jgi:hypothetical protein
LFRSFFFLPLCLFFLSFSFSLLVFLSSSSRPPKGGIYKG